MSRPLITHEMAAAIVVGIATGTALSLWVTRLLEHRLYGISRLDFVSFGAAVGLVVIVMLLSAVPVCRRAVRLDPAEALRD